MAGVAAGYAALGTEPPTSDAPAVTPAHPTSGPASALGADNAAVRHLVSQRRCRSC
ncbi:hypothetical protein MAHJHV57_54650 [Mycobacterium avium subsp. hominissuis]